MMIATSWLNWAGIRAMRAFTIASFCVALAASEACAADFSALRGALTDPAPAPAAPSPFTVGLRYWYSLGRQDYAHDASLVSPILGNPTSELIYTYIPAHSAEIFARYNDAETGLVVKGYLGGGGFADGGTMNDRDWFVGQKLFSNTDSSLKKSDLRYASLDIGWGAEYLTFGRLQFLPFIGYGYWHDGVGIWGLTELPDDFGGAVVGVPPGTVLFTTSQKVGAYTATWNMARLGVEASFAFTSQLGLTVDAAFVPYGQGNGDDSHLLRQDQLGPKPNVLNRGHGYGTQIDAMVHYQVNDALSVGIGGRYWYIDASGTNGSRIDRDLGTRFPLVRFTSERFGALAEAAYRF
jgi:hypothetical protein